MLWAVVGLGRASLLSDWCKWGIVDSGLLAGPEWQTSAGRCSKSRSQHGP